MVVLDEPGLGPVEVFEQPPSRRRFSPGDVLRLVIGLALVGVGTLVARTARSTLEGLETDLVEAFGRLPDGVETALLTFAQLFTSVVPAIAFVVLLVKRRWKVALLLFATTMVSNLAMTAADVVLSNRALDQVLERLQVQDSVVDATYPNSHVVAATIAVVTVAAPWLSQQWKRALWWGVAVLVLLRLMAVAYPAFDVVVAVGVGIASGSLVLLLFGSPSNEPRPEELVDGLVEVGVAPLRIDRRGRVGSSIRYRVDDLVQGELGVTLRTPDEADADLLNRAYRSLRFRSSEVGHRFATLKRRMEHEALALTLAERRDVRAPRVVQLGTTERGSAFLVTQQPENRPLVPDDLAEPEVLTSAWRQLGRLHDAGIAHRAISLEVLRRDDHGAVWLQDFDDAETAPTERDRARDVAELLTETAAVIGAGPAVTAAVDALGPDRVAPSVRMLQPLALPPATRARAKARPELLDQLRAAVIDATGAPELELEDLERVKPRTVLIVVASALAFYSLLPQFANLSDTVSAFGDAELGWIAALVGASAVTYVFAAISFEGAVPEPVPFAPNLRAQVASSFAGLVGPAGAGGFALTGRFLQRLGIGGSEATASVAVNAIGGFAVHAVLMVAFIVWSGQSEFGGFSLPSFGTVLLILAVVLALVGLLVAIGPVRQRFLVPVWRGAKEGVAHIGRVFTNPIRVAGLFGGSLGISLTYVVAMACAVEAFGGGLAFVEIGAAYLVAVAIATLAPTPGGLGALESALIAGLVGFGLDSGAAVSSVLTFRLATFWLPLLPGWLALGWMQRNEEL